MDDLNAVFVALVHQPAPVLKSINAFNSENPEAATAAKSVVSTITAQKKCTRRPDGWARWGPLVCVVCVGAGSMSIRSRTQAA